MWELITVSIAIIVITVNLDLAFCVVSHGMTGALLTGGGRRCALLSATSCRRSQALEVVNCLCYEGVRKGRLGRHAHV